VRGRVEQSWIEIKRFRRVLRARSCKSIGVDTLVAPGPIRQSRILGLLPRRVTPCCRKQLTIRAPFDRSPARLELFGLPVDDEGVDADAFARACAQHAPKALYLNPTLLNRPRTRSQSGGGLRLPRWRGAFGVRSWRMTRTAFFPRWRRRPSPRSPPELTWHVAGLAKCLGAACGSPMWWRRRALRMAVCFGRAYRDGNAVTYHRRACHALDRRRHGRSAACGGAPGIDGAPAARRCGSCARSCRQAAFAPIRSAFTCGCRSGALDALCFVGHMRSTGIGVVAKRRFRDARKSSRSGARCLGGPQTALPCAARLNSWLMRWKPRQPARPRSFERIATSISSAPATQRPRYPLSGATGASKCEIDLRPVMRANASKLILSPR